MHAVSTNQIADILRFLYSFSKRTSDAPDT